MLVFDGFMMLVFDKKCGTVSIIQTHTTFLIKEGMFVISLYFIIPQKLDNMRQGLIIYGSWFDRWPDK